MNEANKKKLSDETLDSLISHYKSGAPLHEQAVCGYLEELKQRRAHKLVVEIPSLIADESLTALREDQASKKLLDCPFCGSTAESGTVREEPHTMFGIVSVVCDASKGGCGAHGGGGVETDEHFGYWNKRHLSPMRVGEANVDETAVSFSLLHRLRTWPLGDIGNQAADAIVSLEAGIQFLKNVNTQLGDKLRAATEPVSQLRYFGAPFKFVEPKSDSEAAQIVDNDGDLVATLFWPAHPMDETEAAEQETYALGRAMAAAGSRQAIYAAGQLSIHDQGSGLAHFLQVPGHESKIEVADAVGPLKLDTDREVFFYEQDHYYLSNFSAFRLFWKTYVFHTSEAAYQFEKFPHSPRIQKAILFAKSAHEAFKIAEASRQYRRPDWDDVKVDIMRQVLRAKVDQHEYVRRKLLETADRVLIENSWRDPYWGWGENRDGLNMLGKLWMEIRGELLNSQSTAASQ